MTRTKPCPSPDTLAAYLTGTLAPAAASSLKAHLADCLDCTRLVGAAPDRQAHERFLAGFGKAVAAEPARPPVRAGQVWTVAIPGSPPGGGLVGEDGRLDPAHRPRVCPLLTEFSLDDAEADRSVVASCQESPLGFPFLIEHWHDFGCEPARLETCLGEVPAGVLARLRDRRLEEARGLPLFRLVQEFRAACDRSRAAWATEGGAAAADPAVPAAVLAKIRAFLGDLAREIAEILEPALLPAAPVPARVRAAGAVDPLVVFSRRLKAHLQAHPELRMAYSEAKGGCRIHGKGKAEFALILLDAEQNPFQQIISENGLATLTDPQLADWARAQAVTVAFFSPKVR